MQNEELILVETPIKYLDWNYPYFTVNEMVCQHTGYLGFNERFMDSLVTLREKCGFGFPVNSYYRHADFIDIKNSHPIELKKLEASNGKKAGSHASGKAIDIGVDRERAYIVLRTAMDLSLIHI